MNTPETLYRKDQVVLDQKTGRQVRVLEIYLTPQRTVRYKVQDLSYTGGGRMIRNHNELAPITFNRHEMKPNVFTKVWPVEAPGLDYEAIRWDGPESTRDLIRAHVDYAEMWKNGCIEVMDDDRDAPAVVHERRWLVLDDQTVFAYNLPDDVFFKRFRKVTE